LPILVLKRFIKRFSLCFWGVNEYFFRRD